MSAIFIELVAALLLFALGFLFKGYILPFCLRIFNALRSLIPFGILPQRIYVGYGLIPPRDNLGLYMLEEGDVRTIYEIERIFSELYGRQTVVMASHADLWSTLDTVDDIVTVSGPRWNKLTERFIGQLGSPLTFDKADETSRVIHNSVEQEPTYYMTDRKPGQIARKCFGIILSGEVRRSDGKQQNVVVCAGNSTLSSYGVALFLRNCINNRTLVKKMREFGIESNKKWGLIIKVTNLRPTGGVSPLNPSDVQVEIERMVKADEFVAPFAFNYLRP